MSDILAYTQAAAREFRLAMGQDIDIGRQIALIKEESLEILAAAAEFERNPSEQTMADLLKELADFVYTLSGLYEQCEASGDGPENHQDEEFAKIGLAANSVLGWAIHSFLEDDLFYILAIFFLIGLVSAIDQAISAILGHKDH